MTGLSIPYIRFLVDATTPRQRPGVPEEPTSRRFGHLTSAKPAPLLTDLPPLLLHPLVSIRTSDIDIPIAEHR